MLKKRIIGIITTKDGIVVQSINFDRYLPVGDVGISIEAFCDWEIDEIILLDIGASKKNNTPFEKN
ncbi:MAG TPA: hypothetical protein EYP80_02760 [Candidatus Aenigmarchaeota archaeon]|nr:hypothetical protein [Candidatus Aenigmarchaeota archaeon]